jgi:hypothetical protein
VRRSELELSINWVRRLLPDAIAWCAYPADLVANKLTVGREKDMAFCRAVL